MLGTASPQGDLAFLTHICILHRECSQLMWYFPSNSHSRFHTVTWESPVLAFKISGEKKWKYKALRRENKLISLEKLFEKIQTSTCKDFLLLYIWLKAFIKWSGNQIKAGCLCMLQTLWNFLQFVKNTNMSYRWPEQRLPPAVCKIVLSNYWRTLQGPFQKHRDQLVLWIR